MSEVQLILKSHPRERRELLTVLATFAAEHHLPPSAVNAADLALEEHLTNVINYGYDGPDSHDILVRLALVNQDFIVEVVDDGKAFNPLNRPAVDVSKPLADRAIGGLGIHLIKQFMDAVDYSRQSGKNTLRMTKRLSAGAA